MKLKDEVQMATEFMFQSVLVLSCNIHDCYGVNDEPLIGRLFNIYGESYTCSYYDPAILSPKDNVSLDNAQFLYRPVDECCCNMESLIENLVSQSEQPKCVIVNLAYYSDNRGKESFLKQIPKIPTQNIGSNKLIIIGEESDLSLIDGKPSIKIIRLGKPSNDYMQEYIHEKLDYHLEEEQIDTIIRICRGRYQMEVRDVIRFLKKRKYSQDSLFEVVNILKLDSMPDMAKKISFDDIVGLATAKEAIDRRVVLPFKHREDFEYFGTSPTGGILLYGPPGTGKTMFGQAVANELNAKFFYISLAEVLDKYLGESEKIIARIFEDACRQTLAVIFFDELDSLMSKRDETSSMTHIQTMLLTGLSALPSNVLPIGATNRLDAIDPAYLRNGRFGSQIYIPLPDKEQRIGILKKKVGEKGEDVNYEILGDKTEGGRYNCADMDALYYEAVANAVLRCTNNSNEPRSLKMKDFELALEKVKGTAQPPTK